MNNNRQNRRIFTKHEAPYHLGLTGLLDVVAEVVICRAGEMATSDWSKNVGAVSSAPPLDQSRSRTPAPTYGGLRSYCWEGGGVGGAPLSLYFSLSADCWPHLEH